jgi:hypothetical protein
MTVERHDLTTKANKFLRLAHHRQPRPAGEILAKLERSPLKIVHG